MQRDERDNGAAMTSRPRRAGRNAGTRRPRPPTGRMIAAPTSAPKRPAAKTKATQQAAIARNAAAPRAGRQLGREARQRRTCAGDDEHAE